MGFVRTDSKRPRLLPTWPGWRTILWEHLQRVRADASAALTSRGFTVDEKTGELSGGDDDKERAKYQDIFYSVKQAVESTERRVKRITARADSAFVGYHRADVELVELLTDDQLLGKVPEVLALLGAYVRDDDDRRVAFQKRFAPSQHPKSPPATPAGPGPATPVSPPATKPAKNSSVSPEDREVFATALRATYLFYDKKTRPIRHMRTVLLGTSAGLILLLGALLAVAEFGSPTAVPMCLPVAQPTPGPTTTITAHATVTARATVVKTEDPGPQTISVATTPSTPQATATDTAQTCATGNHHPTHGDVPLVMLLGAAGAIIAAARTLAALATQNPPLLRNSLAVWQVIVKVSFGGTLAVLGILFVQTGLAPAILNDPLTLTDSKQLQILVYAVIFGYAQQLLTGLIDKNVSSASQDAPLATDGASDKSK